MFRLVNVGGRPALEHAGGFYDVARLADDDSLATADGVPRPLRGAARARAAL